MGGGHQYCEGCRGGGGLWRRDWCSSSLLDLALRYKQLDEALGVKYDLFFLALEKLE
jgi:hypothetical protein